MFKETKVRSEMGKKLVKDSGMLWIAMHWIFLRLQTVHQKMHIFSSSSLKNRIKYALLFAWFKPNCKKNAF